MYICIYIYPPGPIPDNPRAVVFFRCQTLRKLHWGLASMWPYEIFILQDLLHKKCKRNCYLRHTLMLAKLKNTTPAIGACGTDHNIGPGPVILLLSQENDMFEKVVLAIFWHGHCSQLKIKRPSWRYLQTERFRQVMEPNLFAYLGDLLLQCQWKVNRTNHIKQMLEVDLLLCSDLYWESGVAVP